MRKVRKPHHQAKMQVDVSCHQREEGQRRQLTHTSLHGAACCVAASLLASSWRCRRALHDARTAGRAGLAHRFLWRAHGDATEGDEYYADGGAGQLDVRTVDVQVNSLRVGARAREPHVAEKHVDDVPWREAVPKGALRQSPRAGPNRALDARRDQARAGERSGSPPIVGVKALLAPHVCVCVCVLCVFVCASPPAGSSPISTGRAQLGGQHPCTCPTLRIAFRQLSPNNPYLNQEAGGGTEVEVEPAKVGRRLMTCREKLAEDWVNADRACASPPPRRGREGGGGARALRPRQHASATRTATSLASVMQISEGDEQLLKGIAMRLGGARAAARALVAAEPGRTKEWLDRFVFFHRADDLTRNGVVERLLFELETSSPSCIRGGALVDPIDIKRELLIARAGSSTRWPRCSRACARRPRRTSELPRGLPQPRRPRAMLTTRG